MLCFLAAGVFWIFNAFNKTYSTDLQFPLKFEFDQNNYVAERPLPLRIKLNVSGSGWELFRNSLGLRLPQLKVPIDKPAELKKIAANSLIPVLASQMGGLKINYSVTDTLQVNLDVRQSRSFNLKINRSSLSFRAGFGVTGPISITPSTVELDGPASVLHKLPDTILITVPATDLHKTFEEEVEVPLFKNEFIRRNPPLVSVYISVGAVAVTNVKLKVRVINLPPSQNAQYPDSVSVSFVTPIEKQKELMAKIQTTEALVDLKKSKVGVNRIYPGIIGLPAYTQVLSVDSVIVNINK